MKATFCKWKGCVDRAAEDRDYCETHADVASNAALDVKNPICEGCGRQILPGEKPFRIDAGIPKLYCPECGRSQMVQATKEYLEAAPLAVGKQRRDKCAFVGCRDEAGAGGILCPPHEAELRIQLPTPTPESKTADQFDALVDQMRATFRQKNKAYGNSFADFGDYGILIRVSDKLSRLKTLYKNPKIDKGDESIEDTWKDLAVYGVLALICRQEGPK